MAPKLHASGKNVTFTGGPLPRTPSMEPSLKCQSLRERLGNRAWCDEGNSPQATPPP